MSLLGDVTSGIVGSVLGKEAGAWAGRVVGLANPVGFIADTAETLCDGLGAPRWVGDVVSGGINVVGGNYAGAIEDGLELLRSIPPPDEDTGGEETEVDARALKDASGPGGSGADGSRAGATADAERGGSASSAARSFLAEHSDPESFLDALRNGNIPDDVMGSEGGLLMIQQRLHDIQRLNELMTQLTKSMHEMEMAIVRNIRT